MDGYNADENYFSEEGIEANTAALLKKLGGESDAGAPDSQPQQPAAAPEHVENTARASAPPPRPAVHRERFYALLIALLTGGGAVVGALLSSWVRT